MDTPTTLPLLFIHRLIEGKFRIDALESPVATFLGEKLEPVEESLDTPAVTKLNTLLEERKVPEFFRHLANLPQGLSMVVEVPQEHNAPFHPSGRYRFIVGEPKRWKYQLLVISESQHFQDQIAADPRTIGEIARLAQRTGTDTRTAGRLLHPIEEDTVQANAALVALTYQLNAFGAAYVLHPLVANKVIISVTGLQTVEVPTDAKANNLWWFIAQRRAMDYDFHKAVDSNSVEAHAVSATIQQLAQDVAIEYPATSKESPIPGSVIARLEEKLCAIAKRYFCQVAEGIRVNEAYSASLDKMARKIESLKTQIQREKEGRKETWGERLGRWFS